MWEKKKTFCQIAETFIQFERDSKISTNTRGCLKDFWHKEERRIKVLKIFQKEVYPCRKPKATLALSLGLVSTLS